MCGFFRCSGLVSKARKLIFDELLFLIITLLILFCYQNSYAQRAKIESLKKALPALHKSSRVDCLNVLSLAYTYLNADTAKLYAQRAYSEASSINYPRGIGMALNNKARVAGIALHDFPLDERISLQTIQLYKNSKDEKVLTEAYLNLALALFCQSYFDRSATACWTVMRFSKNAGDKVRLGEAIAVMGSINFETGNYEQSFNYFSQSLGVFKSIDDSYDTAILLAKMGDLYCLAGDNKTGLNYYYQSLQYAKGPSLEWHPLVDLGDTYYSLDAYDPGLYDQARYIQTIKSLTIRSNYMAFPGIREAEMHIASKEYDKALILLTEELRLSKARNDKNREMRLLLDIGKVYEGKKEYAKAFYYAKKLLQNAGDHKVKQYMMDGYKSMYTLYDHLHQVDSTYFYYRKYTEMKDSVALGDFSKKMAIHKAAVENEKEQGQIELLSKEKLINQQQLELSGQKLKAESFRKNILVIGVIILVLFGFIVFRNIMLKQKNEATRHEIVEKELTLQKLESEKAKSELQQQATELEMQALRAQMNPHFIFNCLNAINRFTIGNEAAKSADYLTKFAKLIRIVLEQSGRSFIPLEDELHSLQLYMDLEALRFDIPFSYEINTRDFNIGDIQVPPLLLQPFVENAIWHGLHRMKNEPGKINIDLKLDNEILECSICDNGVGRTNAKGLPKDGDFQKKSLGIKLTQNRLELFESSLKDNDGVIMINDLVNESGQSAGTCVLLKIPVKLF